MGLPKRVWVLFALMLVAVGGLVLPGLPGTLGAYVWLGLFPGLAMARLLAPRGGPFTRWTLGLAFSPLVTALAGWALLAAGLRLETAARVVGLAGWVLFASSEARSVAPRADEPDAAPITRFVVGWALACAAFVALPALLNPFVRVHSDAWVHASLVREIQHHGVPPQDPRFAGLPLNYVWMFNLFVALCCGLRGQDPFVFMSIFNVAGMVALIALAWQLAWTVWGSAREAQGTVMLLTLGLNAGAWMLWPLRFLRALTGEVTGWPEMMRQIVVKNLASFEVLYFLQAPFAWMVNFWDKWTIGTSLGYAYVLMLTYLWAFVRWNASGSIRWLAVAGLSAAGTMFMHGVVGLSIIPVSMGALALAAFLRMRASWLPEPRRLAAFAGATLLGAATAVPYTQAISRGWAASRSGFQHHYLQPGWQMPWTIATALALPVLLLPAALRRLQGERRDTAAWLAMFALGMLAFSLVVRLPDGNEVKFVFELFVPLTILSGAVFLPALDRWRERLKPPAFGALVAVLFVIPNGLFLYGLASEPLRRTDPALNPRPGEEALYRWIRTSSPNDAVFTDHHARDLVMVKGERRLLAGAGFGPEKAGYPLAELLQRRRRMAELYTVDPAAPVHVDSLAGTMQPLAGAPLFVLYRPEDWSGAEAPWGRLDADPARFHLAYDHDGYRVYDFRPGP